MMKLTPENIDVFCAVLAETCNVTKACEAVGITRVGAWKARTRNPEFAERWAEAMKIGLTALEDEAHRRAFEGHSEPIVNKDGEIVGARTKYSDTLAIFLLKAHDPAKYRENVAIEHTGKDGGPIEINATQRAARLAGLVDKLKRRKQDTGEDLV